MNHKKIIFISMIIIMLIIILYQKISSSTNDLLNENIFISSNSSDVSTDITSEISTIKIHITGEVKKPGLYEIEEGSRINDLLLFAGGQTENADLNKVNLAYELSDGQKIYIPSIFDEASAYIDNEAGENVLETSSSSTSTNKININSATIEELQSISGIGPSMAQKIIAYRNTNGKFHSIEELKNISGIGEKKFETIKEFLILK